MCSRAVRCWGRVSVQHCTTSYGLRHRLRKSMYWNPMTRRRDEWSRFLVSVTIGANCPRLGKINLALAKNHRKTISDVDSFLRR